MRPFGAAFFSRRFCTYLIAFGTTVETVPHFDWYIFAGLDQLNFWNSALGHIKSPKIGIMAEESNSFIGD
jgi:hypothetical protein